MGVPLWDIENSVFIHISWRCLKTLIALLPIDYWLSISENVIHFKCRLLAEY